MLLIDCNRFARDPRRVSGHCANPSTSRIVILWTSSVTWARTVIFVRTLWDTVSSCILIVKIAYSIHPDPDI